MKTEDYPGRGYARLTNILQLIAMHRNGLSLSELSRLTEVPKSTVHLITRHLLESGYLNFNEENKRFTKGPSLLSLAFKIVDSVQIPQFALPLLEKLSLETELDTYLAIRTDTKAIYISKVAGTHSVQVNIGLGIPRLLHCTAVGKVFLAWEKDGLIDKVVNDYGLPAVTGKTITNRSQLEKELRKVRKQGYAISDEEGIDSIFGIAAPIWNHKKKVEAAVHISCLKKFVEGREEKYINACVSTAKSISRALYNSI